MLDTDHFVACTADRPNDFVEFQVQCTSVPILSVLDQKNDEKRDNRCGIYDLLPGVRIMKIRTGGAPKYDNEHRQYECPSRSYPSGGFGSYRSEPNTECLIFLVLFHSAHLVWCAWMRLALHRSGPRWAKSLTDFQFGSGHSDTPNSRRGLKS